MQLSLSFVRKQALFIGILQELLFPFLYSFLQILPMARCVPILGISLLITTTFLVSVLFFTVEAELSKEKRLADFNSILTEQFSETKGTPEVKDPVTGT